jgi:uncharacterized protein (DUF2147 family)
MTQNRISFFVRSMLAVAPMMFAAGCVAEAESPMAAEDSVAASDQKFEAWSGAEGFLIANTLSGSTIRVCLSGTGVNDTTRPGFQNNIRDAIMIWVNGARPVSTTR